MELKEFCCKLKTKRESLNLSLLEISAKTKISTSILRAIEDFDESSFPRHIYLNAHIKSYASILGETFDEQINKMPNVESITPEIEKNEKDNPSIYIIIAAIIILVIYYIFVR